MFDFETFRFRTPGVLLEGEVVVDVSIPDYAPVPETGTPSSILYNADVGALRWLGMPNADFVVTAYSSATSTDAVATVRVPGAERDVSTGTNGTHNRVVTFNISQLDLTDGTTYFLRVQAVPKALNPVVGATPAVNWGAPGPLSGPIEVVYISSTFPDVNISDWFYSAVMYAYDNEIMEGFPDGTFGPNETLTRAQVVTILYRLEGAPSVADLENPFSDVAAGQWWYDQIVWAADAGVSDGFPDGTFRGNDPVTKEQLAAFIARAQVAADKIPEPVVDAAFSVWPDLDSISSWAVEAVTVLSDQGLFVDIPGANFAPQSSATRAMVASVLYKWLSQF